MLITSVVTIHVLWVCDNIIWKIYLNSISNLPAQNNYRNSFCDCDGSLNNLESSNCVITITSILSYNITKAPYSQLFYRFNASLSKPLLFFYKLQLRIYSKQLMSCQIIAEINICYP